MNDASNNEGNGLDLSALNFGPAWAKDETKKKDYSNYEVKERSGGDRRKGGRNDRNQRQGGPRQGGGRDNRRDNKGGPRRDDDGRGQRRDGGRPKFVQVPSPEGFSGEVMPIEEGLDRLAKQIQQTARTYSVFDLARMVLQSRDRFNVGLKAPKGQKMFRNTTTASTFLTKEEAIEDFWKSEVKEKFYKEVKKEVEAPTGNYPSVAKCRKTGIYLGPPNHHSYQSNLRAHHRERFASLSYEAFLRGVEVIKGEDAVNEWIEQQKIQLCYLPLGGVHQEVSSVVEAPSSEADSSGEKTEQEAPEVDDSLLLKSRQELERHFLDNHFDEAYKQVQISWVPSMIPGKLLSPSLLTLLKETVSEERRYPGKLSSLMCRQLSGRNVAVFKLHKKLKAGPSRPHALPKMSSLADRPKALLEWTMQNDGKGIDALWESILPENVTEQEKAEWFHDLKWLLTQGYVSLLEEGTLSYSKKEMKSEEKPKAKKSKKGKNVGLKTDTAVEKAKESKEKPLATSESVEIFESLLSDADIVRLEIQQRIETVSLYTRAREKKLLEEARKKERGQKKVSNIGKAVAARSMRSGKKEESPKNLPDALKRISQG